MSWTYAAIALVAGAAIAIQVGVNNGLRVKLDQPIIAAITSFASGTLVLLVYGLIARTPWPSATQWKAGPWWAWLGGSLGAVYLLLTVTFSRKLGAASWLGIVVTGQIVTSVVLDHFGLLGFDPHAVSWLRVGGVVLLLTGAAVVLGS